MKIGMTLTQEKLKEYLTYDPDSGCFIRNKNAGTKKKGEIAGYNVAGYTYITIDNVAYPAHRLVFLYVDNIYPESDVDHINMNRKDNRYSNLRISSRRLNMLNIKAHQDSNTGVKNVFFRADTNKYNVRMTINGRYKSLGCFDDLELATLVADYAREKYHGEYARSQ